jgi:hypothetical protein
LRLRDGVSRGFLRSYESGRAGSPCVGRREAATLALDLEYTMTTPPDKSLKLSRDNRSCSTSRDLHCDFPLHSTGRGIEGEEWEDSSRPRSSFRREAGNGPIFFFAHLPAFSPLTPALSPLRGEGEPTSPASGMEALLAEGRLTRLPSPLNGERE